MLLVHNSKYLSYVLGSTPEWVVRDHNYPFGIEVERVPVIMQ